MARANRIPGTVGHDEIMPSRRHFEHALLLIARQHGGDPAAAEAARLELERWRQADPAHESAFCAAARGWDATDAHALRGTFALPARHGESVRRRRHVLAALAVGGLLFGLAGAGGWLARQPVHELALGTAKGQVQSVNLPDGTRIDAGAKTAAHIAYYRDRREVRLAEGEIRLAVHPDAARPFTVVTAWGQVRVLGTVFTVAASDERMRVAVAEGRVAVRANGSGPVPGAQPSERYADVELTAGQRIEADAGGLGQRGEVRPMDVGAWRQGWLVFDDTPLAEAVARWNDYLARPIALDHDTALHGLRLTGSFPLQYPGAFLSSLPAILPVRVHADAGAAVRVEARH